MSADLPIDNENTIDEITDTPVSDPALVHETSSATVVDGNLSSDPTTPIPTESSDPITPVPT
ncbi:MAG TPA: hypothetical protein VIY29_16510, partial [Ktedonobacteraceae bacterium]